MFVYCDFGEDQTIFHDQLMHKTNLIPMGSHTFSWYSISVSILIKISVILTQYPQNTETSKSKNQTDSQNNQKNFRFTCDYKFDDVKEIISEPLNQYVISVQNFS